jgi:prepilin-type N-terminal cleavage/methylation domain-containing protein
MIADCRLRIADWRQAFGVWHLGLGVWTLRNEEHCVCSYRHATNRKSVRAAAGFTLIEVMVALAILGVSAMVLLDAHYNALRLHADTRDQVLAQQFLEEAVGQAEVQVMAGTLTGSGTFGKQYPDYSFSFSAQPFGAQQGIPLYEVVVTLTGLPSGSDKESSGDAAMTFYVYNLGQ